jgi:hypothetical protein
LLARQNELTDGDTQTLERLIDALGLTAEEVEEHSRAVERAKELAPVAASLEDRMRSMREAKQELTDYVADWQARETAMRMASERLSTEQHKAEGLVRQSGEAQEELKQLALKYPQLRLG